MGVGCFFNLRRCLMPDITLTVVQDGLPVIEIDGKYFTLEGEHREGLKKTLIQTARALERYNIHGVKAYGGKRTPHPPVTPAANMETLVHFDDIIIEECGGRRTRDAEVITLIFFALGLLVWYKAGVHFTRVSNTQMFRCVVCGNLQNGALLEERVPCADAGSIPPDYCTDDACYSHIIEKTTGQKKLHV